MSTIISCIDEDANVENAIVIAINAKVQSPGVCNSRFGSRHSEVIITENITTAETFLNSMDAATVYVNTSTRFTDV